MVVMKLPYASRVMTSGGATVDGTRVPTDAPREKIQFLGGAYMVK
jgi:hypothetical protein